MAGDGLEDEGTAPQHRLQTDAGRVGRQHRLVIEHGRAVFAAPDTPDAALPPGADVAEDSAQDDQPSWATPNENRPTLRGRAKPREVEVRDLKAARAGRVFPCMQQGPQYTGCIGYDACNVLCWSPRPRERDALVRAEKPTGGPCRDCIYAREVRGEVATLNGRQVRLMECRLGYWHGRTTVSDFALNKIALNVGLPCPGYTETDMPHPAVARLREAARSRRMRTLFDQADQDEQEDQQTYRRAHPPHWPPGTAARHTAFAPAISGGPGVRLGCRVAARKAAALFVAPASRWQGWGATHAPPTFRRKQREGEREDEGEYMSLSDAIGDFEQFSRELVRRPLRAYQMEAIRAIFASIDRRDGAIFTVMMARQMGKNELSAQLEAWLLFTLRASGASLVKASPTLRPQGMLSKRRLREVLLAAQEINPTGLLWREREGHIIENGHALIAFYSASETANVIGATARPLLEIDEAQEIDEQKYLRDFRPMGATANATTVLYGTAWTGETLLEQQKQHNLELEARAARLDGTRRALVGPPRRHFEYPWTALAGFNPDYKAYVEAEIERLGPTHPIIRTQYLLQPVAEQDHLFTAAQLEQLRGTHPRLHSPRVPGERRPLYVAGIDVAGADEGIEGLDGRQALAHPQRDATVVTIAEALPDQHMPGFISLQIVEQHEWVGLAYREQHLRLSDLLRHVWGCARVVIDASGIGAGLAAWLEDTLGGSIVECFQFTRASKSTLGWDLLAAVNTGRLKMYADDGSPESRHFWDEARHAHSVHLPGQTLNFFVPVEKGHDDYLMSAALCVHAAAALAAPAAGKLILPPRFYRDGGY